MKPTMSKSWMMGRVQLVLVFLFATCFMAGLVMASGKPIAVTKAATYVSSASARLNGTAKPNGLLTTIYWEYGTTTAYGSKTSMWSAGSGTNNKDFWGDIGSLASKTTYHFRFVAENSAGKAYGADMTFATTALKPSVQTGPATQITTNSARLTGVVNPNGLKTTCQFNLGKTTAYESGIGSSPAGNGTSNVTVYLDLKQLQVNAIYHYQLQCENSSGVSYGSDMSFKTKTINLLQPLKK